MRRAGSRSSQSKPEQSRSQRTPESRWERPEQDPRPPGQSGDQRAARDTARATLGSFPRKTRGQRTPQAPRMPKSAEARQVSLANVLNEQLLEQVFRVARQLAEDHTHTGRISLDAHDLTDAFYRLNVAHDDPEPEVHTRSHRDLPLRFNENAPA